MTQIAMTAVRQDELDGYTLMTNGNILIQTSFYSLLGSHMGGKLIEIAWEMGRRRDRGWDLSMHAAKLRQQSCHFFGSLLD